jgi:TPP-dependent trihydroxycyclohexane-1,2-dione (THcHDO) dehydratase
LDYACGKRASTGQLAAQHNRNKADCLTGGGGQVKKFPTVSKIAFGKDEFILNNLMNLH